MLSSTQALTLRYNFYRNIIDFEGGNHEKTY